MPAFLLEVGTEDLPASFVDGALSQWRDRIPASLADVSISPGSIEIFGTPRRLSVLLHDLPLQQADRTEEIKGPPLKAAFRDGQPTQAAVGFARTQGVTIEDFEIRDTPKGEFIFVNKHVPGRATAEILTELIPEWIFKLEGKRFMRWADGDLRFPRPVRWLVALLDDQVLPLTITSGSDVVQSDRQSRGHRVLHPEPVTIATACEYCETLRSAFVEVDPTVRAATIREQVEAAGKQAGGTADINADLLAEVTHLVEWPTAVLGQFEDRFSVLPSEVITTVMVSHQRYFPVLNTNPTSTKTTDLLPNFITISNGDPRKSEIIALGNQRVIRARLADGEFFYKADCEQPLETFVPQLETITFQEDLGTVKDKVDRFTIIADRLASRLQLSVSEQATIARASLLCKADLVSQMVYEFPELQGIMGEKYAIVSGESPEVAKAIVEHYRPRGADDDLPVTIAGQIVGIADRLDTLVSIFGLGLLPSGSSDPYALRRAANAIVNIIWSANLKFDLNAILRECVTDFRAAHPDASPDLLAQLQAFFIQRVQTLLQDDRGVDYDFVNAVLGENDAEYRERAIADLLDTRDRALFLQSIRQDGTIDQIYATINRSAKLAQKGDLATDILDPTAAVNPDLFQSPAEQAVFDVLTALLPTTKTAQADRNYRLLVDALAEAAPTVAEFFDGENSVLVMDPDAEIKANRLNLLGLLRNHARVLADFGAIVKPA
ncbi:MAG: glycine--tRNA ligase subunit beta [Oscillatoriales cyanobacterium]|nr:MAG: glycine--tRNA ligase subunit beta [Oscillatoriales cyanobacterium]